MKSYLLTMLIMFVIGLVSSDGKPPSESVKALATVVRLILVGWTIYLLVNL